MRVLIVDDAAFMRLMVKNLCNEAGYEVVGEAGDGDAALRKYKQLSPDLVIMDIIMPDTDGIAALHQILEYDPAAKIIMCSAMGQKEYVVKAIQAGAKDFIVKPFDKATVQQIISRVIA